MYRKGKYTESTGPLKSTKRFVKRRWNWFKGLSKKKKALLIAGPILAFLIVTPIATYAYYYNDIGNQERLLNRNNTGVVLLDRNGEVFFSTDGRAEQRELVPLNQISDETEKALIAAEDKDFYKHSGFDIFGIIRALYSNLVARDITGGGSTLTQQLAKNTLLTERQTILRKYQELVISIAIEQRYSKDEILTMYLNSVYYGENSFGIEEAAKNYFNKKPSELTLAEGSMLIGVLPAPTAYSPISGDPELAKKRQTTVLSRMVKNGYITEAEKTSAANETIAYAPPSEGIDNAAPHFTEMVLNELYEKYGEEKVTRSGYQVTTTLDLKLQEKANSAVQSNMRYIQANGGSNASLVAIDPKTGGILALVGSADYTNEEYGKVNMATTARQPGSSFKPLYYADALASGKITPVTVVEDKKTDFGGYSPQNADRRFRGNVTVRQALSWSLNVPAVKVMQLDGMSNAMAAVKRLGITSIDPNANYGLSLALGSAEVPLIDMTNAYAAFANQGDRYDESSIKSIKNKYDQTLFTQSRKSTEAISSEGSYLLSSILSDNQTRSSVFGSSLNVTGTDGRIKNVAVKTGTTDDSRDAWTIGYTPDITVGVWVGNNDNAIMNNGGSSMAGPIWRNMMGQAIGTNNPTFTQPSGVVKATVCTSIGTRSDVFLSSNVPKKCDAPKETKKEEPEEEKETETAKCTVPGKENLAASDSGCVVEQCEVEGLQNLASNDPRCVEPEDDETESKDTDKDGVPDANDQCPNTPSGVTVNSSGCPVVSGGTGTGQGQQGGRPGSGGNTN